MSGSSYTQYQIDVLAFVQAWHSGTLSNNGFQLRSGSGTNSERLVECHSSEYAGPGIGQQPRLTVDWDLPAVTRSTYSLAGQVVAVRTAGYTDSSKNGLFYIHSDHLSSNSFMTKANGDLVAGSVSRYTPFGDWRTEPTAALTDIGYTGHRHNNLADNDLGLVYMQARYYMPGLGRFASADSLVPNFVQPQSFNRYSYSYNNPVKYSDPSGHTPWDIIDAIFFGISAYQFAVNPTWGNAGWLAVDAVSLLPVLPSVGWLRYGDEAVQLYNSVSRAVARIGLEGGQNLLQIISRFNDGGQLTLDFLKIADIPGAQKIARNLANGAWQTVKGSRFELEYAVSHADDIAEIGRSLGGGREIDFVLKNGGFVDVKNYNWASNYYQNSMNLQRTIDGFIRQAREYLRHTDMVTFTFKGSVPDAVRKALEELDVIVEVIP